MRALKIVLWLPLGAVVVAAVVGLLPGVVAAGPLPVGVLVLGLAWMLWTAHRMGLFARTPRSRGACWATVPELRAAGFLAPYGWILGSIDGHLLRVPEATERESILVCAAPGSGKSAGLAIGAILSEADRPVAARRTLVVGDGKDELTRKTLPTLAKTHQCLVFAPSDPEACTVGWDPLSALPDPGDERYVGEVKTLARAFCEATLGSEGSGAEARFWINQARSLTEALFLAFVVTHPQGTFVELADWIGALTIQSFQDMLDTSPHPAVRASAAQLRALGLSDRTLGPIMGDILQRFDVLIDPGVRRAMSGPSIDWSALLTQEQPAAVYLRIGAQDAERLAPLVSLMLGGMYRAVTRVAARHPNNVLPRGMRVLIDEFGTLPRVLGIDTALDTLRSYDVGHYLFVQNTAQLDHRYGEKLAKSIQSNIVTKVILGGASLHDARTFSELAGEVTEQVPAISDTRTGLRTSRTHGYQPDRHPLIPASEIVRLRGYALISTPGVPPICAELRLYFKDQALVRRLEEDRAAFDQSVVQRPASSMASSPASAEPKVGRGTRDVPPPGCSAQEWDAAPPSLRVARGSAEEDLFDLVTGRVADLDQIRERWRATPAQSTAARYGRITAADRRAAPAIAAYVDELALRLELRQEDDPEGSSI